MKKLFSIFIFILTLIFFTSNCAFAKNTNNEIKMIRLTEYDLYKQMISKTDEELKKQGLNDEEIKELRNFDFNKVLLERAKLNNDELKKMGYTDEQIFKLKKLYGQIKDTRQAKDKISVQDIYAAGIFADLILTTWLVSGSDTSITVGFSWRWSNLPVYYGGRDVIAVIWQGTNTNGQPINVSIDTSASYHKVQETNTTSPQLDGKVTNLSFEVEDYYHSAKSEFQLGYRIEDMIGWYQNGWGVIKVNRTGSHYIKEVAMKISYGHTYILVNPGVSFSPISFSINFNWNCENMATENAIYSKYGKRIP
jgi:hypothetical protein